MHTKETGGATIPSLGFGTYQLYGEGCTQAVRDALEMGYRHVDTAELYDNHQAVGRGIEESNVDREDVFLTTKVWKTSLEPKQVHETTRSALDAMGTEYVDLLLIHGPNSGVPIPETIRAMNELQQTGAVRHIGVSNFSVSQLRTATEASQTPIVTNQVEYHPRKRQDELLEFALEEDVLLTAYSPLAKGSLVDDPLLTEIGGRYDRTAAQIAIRWLVQQPNVVTIPKAADRDHRHDNRQIFEFSLSPAEMRSIFGIRGDSQAEIVDRIIENATF